jgi:hypothetical protein
MTRVYQLTPEFVEHIPDRPAPGIIYVSKRYATALHLCCCGCGAEVVTPLNPAKWRLKEDGGTVFLFPSIGNWSFPCRSHYWIEGNRVRWAGAMAPEVIAAVKARDRRDAAALAPEPVGFLAKLRLLLAQAFQKSRRCWRL